MVRASPCDRFHIEGNRGCEEVGHFFLEIKLGQFIIEMKLI